MRTRGKIVLAALTATLVLGAAAGTTAARRIEITEKTFLIRWDNVAPRTYLIFRGIGGGEFGISCRVTLKGSFHSRTISKVSGQLIGYIEGGEEMRVAHPCLNSDITGEYFLLDGVEILAGRVVTNTLPWHIRYLSFSGTLPAIAGIKIAIVGFSILASVPFLGWRCLYKSTAEFPFIGTMNINTTTGAITGFTVDETSQLPLFAANEGSCTRVAVPSGTAFWGDGPKSGTAVRVRLVQ